MTIEVRQFLAFLSLEAGKEVGVIRQLRPIAQAGPDTGLTVAVSRSVCLLYTLLNAHGGFAESADIARRVLASAEGMPINPITMDVQLILARGLLDVDEVDEALCFAEPVAHWLAFTVNEERTDAAFPITSTAVGLGNNPRQAAKPSIKHDEYLGHNDDTKGATKAYRQVVRSIIHVIDLVISEEGSEFTAGVASKDASAIIDHIFNETEDFLLRFQKLVPDDWPLVDWHSSAAYVFYPAGCDTSAINHVGAAARDYLQSGDSKEVVRALPAGVRYRLDAGDSDDTAVYARHVEEFLPYSVQEGHPVLNALDVTTTQSFDDEYQRPVHFGTDGGTKQSVRS